MTPPRNNDSDRLPGEFSEEEQDAAMRAVGLKMISASMEGIPDDFLAGVVALYHEEWERRHGERWVIAE